MEDFGISKEQILCMLESERLDHQLSLHMLQNIQISNENAVSLDIVNQDIVLEGFGEKVRNWLKRMWMAIKKMIAKIKRWIKVKLFRAKPEKIDDVVDDKALLDNAKMMDVVKRFREKKDNDLDTVLKNIKDMVSELEDIPSLANNPNTLKKIKDINNNLKAIDLIYNERRTSRNNIRLPEYDKWSKIKSTGELPDLASLNRILDETMVELLQIPNLNDDRYIELTDVSYPFTLNDYKPYLNMLYSPSEGYIMDRLDDYLRVYYDATIMAKTIRGVLEIPISENRKLSENDLKVWYDRNGELSDTYKRVEKITSKRLSKIFSDCKCSVCVSTDFLTNPNAFNAELFKTMNMSDDNTSEKLFRSKNDNIHDFKQDARDNIKMVEELNDIINNKIDYDENNPVVAKAFLEIAKIFNNNIFPLIQFDIQLQAKRENHINTIFRFVNEYLNRISFEIRARMDKFLDKLLKDLNDKKIKLRKRNMEEYNDRIDDAIEDGDMNLG